MANSSAARQAPVRQADRAAFGALAGGGLTGGGLTGGEALLQVDKDLRDMLKGKRDGLQLVYPGRPMNVTVAGNR
jgi:hypothetical protein